MTVNMKDKIQVLFLGSGNAFYDGGRNMQSLLLTANRISFLLDFSPGALQQMLHLKIDPENVDGLFTSHFHGDHCGGIPFLLLYFHFKSKRTKPFTIIGPIGIENHVKNLTLSTYPELVELERKYDLKFVELASHTSWDNGKGLKVVTFPVRHKPESLGFRFTINGRIIAITSDTGWTEDLLPLANQSDLFICECNNFDTEMTGHLSYLEIKKNEKNLKAKKIVLNHVGQELLDNLERVHLTVASDGDIYVI